MICEGLRYLIDRYPPSFRHDRFRRDEPVRRGEDEPADRAGPGSGRRQGGEEDTVGTPQGRGLGTDVYIEFWFLCDHFRNVSRADCEFGFRAGYKMWVQRGWAI